MSLIFIGPTMQQATLYARAYADRFGVMPETLSIQSNLRQRLAGLKPDSVTIVLVGEIRRFVPFATIDAIMRERDCIIVPEIDQLPAAPYPSPAETAFRKLLATDPAKALSRFLTAKELEYEGTCETCRGTGILFTSKLWVPGMEDQPGGRLYLPKISCKSCSGTGGPPARHLLFGAADWYGDSMEGEVIRSIIPNEKGE